MTNLIRLEGSSMTLARTLRDAYNLSNPVQPLKPGDPRYVDCTPVRVYTEEKQREIARELAAEARLGIGLPENMPLAARLLARVTGQIKTGQAVKTEIRRRLDPQISQLIGNLNLLLDAAHERIRRQDKRGLVLLIDNLDRIVFRDLGDGRTTHYALYVEHGEQLRALHSHTIYTVPISVMYSDRATTVTAIFPDYQVLPMLKVRNRDGSDYPAGLGYLREILASRMDLDILFTHEAIDLLCWPGYTCSRQSRTTNPTN